jgi:hypothetical protein
MQLFLTTAHLHDGYVDLKCYRFSVRTNSTCPYWYPFKRLNFQLPRSHALCEVSPVDVDNSSSNSSSSSSDAVSGVRAQ